MKKRTTYHSDIILEVMETLRAKGITSSDKITAEAWNMAYDCVHAKYSIEMLEWKHRNLTVSL